MRTSRSRIGLGDPLQRLVDRLHVLSPTGHRRVQQSEVGGGGRPELERDMIRLLVGREADPPAQIINQKQLTKMATATRFVEHSHI